MKLFNGTCKKSLNVLKKHKKGSMEDINRSLHIVEHILNESYDLNIHAQVVTTALKLMKENSKQDISDAIVNAYEECIK